ncbi:hypothetical protein DSUL_170006 [Desulfovibrionales bacterium]
MNNLALAGTLFYGVVGKAFIFFIILSLIDLLELCKKNYNGLHGSFFV